MSSGLPKSEGSSLIYWFVLFPGAEESLVPCPREMYRPGCERKVPGSSQFGVNLSP